MPLRCDCYPGCWGDHSEGWPSVPKDYFGHPLMVRNILKKAGIRYGSYVIMENEVRVETEEMRRSLIHHLGIRESLSRDIRSEKIRAVSMSVVNQLFDLAEVPVTKRQEINDTADEFVEKMIRSLL